MEEYSVKFNGKKVIYTDVLTPWRFVNSDKKPYDAELKLVECKREETGITASSYHYENSSKMVSAKRICFSDDKNIVFFGDIIKAAEDICVYTDFIMANADLSASCNVADKNKLVIRNKECGIKHFRLHSELDGNSVLDKTGLMMPVSVKESGDVVYSMYDGLYSFGKEHINCFGLASDSLDKIIYWHLNKTERGYTAETPSKKGGLEIEILSENINLYDCQTGECLAAIKL